MPRVRLPTKVTTAGVCVDALDGGLQRHAHSIMARATPIRFVLAAFRLPLHDG